MRVCARVRCACQLVTVPACVRVCVCAWRRWHRVEAALAAVGASHEQEFLAQQPFLEAVVVLEEFIKDVSCALNVLHPDTGTGMATREA